MQDFWLRPVTVTDEEFNQWYLKSFPGKAKPDATDVNVLFAKLEVVESAVQVARSIWDPIKYEFKSNSGKQTLFVELIAPWDAENETHRYHIDHISCARGDLVKWVHHRANAIPPGDSRHPLVPCDPGTTSVAIEFKMPKNGKTEPFKFSVYVRKTDTNDLHDADPQAGNDPPPAGGVVGGGP